MDDAETRKPFEWMILPLKRYADFSGRSRRREFWWYMLLSVVVSLVLQFAFDSPIDPADPFAIPALFGGWPSLLFIVATIVPTLAVFVRRMHDVDRTGWWVLAIAIPYIGVLSLMIWNTLDGTDGPNCFGEDPKGGSSVDPSMFT